MLGKLTYKAAGVDYDPVDDFKILCQRLASDTEHHGARLKVFPELGVRGESVFTFTHRPENIGFAPMRFGHVGEGLGTKNLVANAMRKHTQLSYYDHIAICNAAMAFNDAITLGILPATYAIECAAGSSEWFSDKERAEDLARGIRAACDMARCIWGPGETSVLKGIVCPDVVALSGSVVGVQKGNRAIKPGRIQDRDAILIFESSGIHANGLSLARAISDRLPDGYATRLSDGRMYGEALLDPTHIYVRFMEELLDAGIDVHYAVNITGHGWRKLMRSSEPFEYVIELLPKQFPVFDFMQKHAGIDDAEMYGTFNMGAGFAVYISPLDIPRVMEAHHRYLTLEGAPKFDVFAAGSIRKAEKKRVVIAPRNIVFENDSLAIR